VIIRALNKDELYASTSLEMLIALFEKIELHRNRKNMSPIEKNKALLEALYQENETDSLYVTRPLRYQRTETRPIRSHLNSCQVKDAVQKFINAVERLLKEVMIPARFF
jgi:hypothetical protein